MGIKTRKVAAATLSLLLPLEALCAAAPRRARVPATAVMASEALLLPLTWTRDWHANRGRLTTLDLVVPVALDIQTSLAKKIDIPARLETSPGSLPDVLARLAAGHPALRPFILDSDGAPRRTLRFFGPSGRIAGNDHLSPGLSFSFSPAIAGGSDRLEVPADLSRPETWPDSFMRAYLVAGTLGHASSYPIDPLPRLQSLTSTSSAGSAEAEAILVELKLLYLKAFQAHQAFKTHAETGVLADPQAIAESPEVLRSIVRLLDRAEPLLAKSNDPINRPFETLLPVVKAIYRDAASLASNQRDTGVSSLMDVLAASKRAVNFRAATQPKLELKHLRVIYDDNYLDQLASATFSDPFFVVSSYIGNLFGNAARHGKKGKDGSVAVTVRTYVTKTHRIVEVDNDGELAEESGTKGANFRLGLRELKARNSLYGITTDLVQLAGQEHPRVRAIVRFPLGADPVPSKRQRPDLFELYQHVSRVMPVEPEIALLRRHVSALSATEAARVAGKGSSIPPSISAEMILEAAERLSHIPNWAHRAQPHKLTLSALGVLQAASESEHPERQAAALENIWRRIHMFERIERARYLLAETGGLRAIVTEQIPKTSPWATLDERILALQAAVYTDNPADLSEAEEDSIALLTLVESAGLAPLAQHTKRLSALADNGDLQEDVSKKLAQWFTRENVLTKASYWLEDPDRYRHFSRAFPIWLDRLFVLLHLEAFDELAARGVSKELQARRNLFWADASAGLRVQRSMAARLYQDALQYRQVATTAEDHDAAARATKQKAAEDEKNERTRRAASAVSHAVRAAQAEFRLNRSENKSVLVSLQRANNMVHDYLLDAFSESWQNDVDVPTVDKAWRDALQEFLSLQKLDANPELSRIHLFAVSGPASFLQSPRYDVQEELGAVAEFTFPMSPTLASTPAGRLLADLSSAGAPAQILKPVFKDIAANFIDDSVDDSSVFEIVQEQFSIEPSLTFLGALQERAGGVLAVLRNDPTAPLLKPDILQDEVLFLVGVARLARRVPPDAYEPFSAWMQRVQASFSSSPGPMSSVFIDLVRQRWGERSKAFLSYVFVLGPVSETLTLFFAQHQQGWTAGQLALLAAVSHLVIRWASRRSIKGSDAGAFLWWLGAARLYIAPLAAFDPALGGTISFGLHAAANLAVLLGPRWLKRAQSPLFWESFRRAA